LSVSLKKILSKKAIKGVIYFHL